LQLKGVAQDTVVHRLQTSNPSAQLTRQPICILQVGKCLSSDKSKRLLCLSVRQARSPVPLAGHRDLRPSAIPSCHTMQSGLGTELGRCVRSGQVVACPVMILPPGR
jgi:hypothetical protein